MFKIEIEGLDHMMGRLRELERRAAALNGEHTVPLKELFPDEFMLLNTNFDSIESMFQASGFTLNSQADFEAIPADVWDAFIARRTRFTSWREMMSAGTSEYLSRTLSL